MYHNKEYLLELSEKINENIDFDRLINVTFNVDTEDVKFYTFSKDLDYFNKYSNETKINQYTANKNKKLLHDYERKVIDFLGYKPDFSEILVDVIMGDVIYFTTGMASRKEFEKFYKTLLKKFNIEEKEFFEVLSRLNNRKIIDFETAFKYKTISVSKVPLNEGYFKVYSEPFKYGNSFSFNEKTIKFLEKLLSCSPLNENCLKSCITIYEFGTGRMQISTQDEELKRKLFKAADLNSKFKFIKK